MLAALLLVEKNPIPTSISGEFSRGSQFEAYL